MLVMNDLKSPIEQSEKLHTYRMLWVGRYFKGQLVPNPCHEQGHPSLHQSAQSPIPQRLKHFKDWGIHSFSQQLVSVAHHSYSKEFPPNIQSKSALF